MDCWGCGLSRGFIAILSFDLKSATMHNVFSIPLFVGIVIYALLCISDILFERNDLEWLGNRIGKKYTVILYLIAFLLLVYLNQHRQ